MTYPPRLSAHQGVRLAIVVGVIAPFGSHMQSEQEGRMLKPASGPIVPGEVTDTLELALEASGCDQAKVVHRLRLLSDNGSSYISSELTTGLGERNITHTRNVPYHPQTQSKIERWHHCRRETFASILLLRT